MVYSWRTVEPTIITVCRSNPWDEEMQYYTTEVDHLPWELVGKRWYLHKFKNSVSSNMWQYFAYNIIVMYTASLIQSSHSQWDIPRAPSHQQCNNLLVQNVRRNFYIIWHLLLIFHIFLVSIHRNSHDIWNQTLWEWYTNCHHLPILIVHKTWLKKRCCWIYSNIIHI